MIELIQFPWSPFCIVQRRILEFSGLAFKITNIPTRTGPWSGTWTRQRYYGVPIIRDGSSVVFEVDEESQVIAKYLDAQAPAGALPRELEGVQSILWRYIENEIEGIGFKLNDIYWKEFVPTADQLAFLRHKERKFGRGCLDQWARNRRTCWRRSSRLVPFEEMLMYQPFLLGERPRFVDFDLFGILGNFLYSGHYRLPPAHNSSQSAGTARMTRVQAESPPCEEKLHPRHQRPAPRPQFAAQFEDNNVLLPIEVIEEIDRFKRESTELGPERALGFAHVGRFSRPGQLERRGDAAQRRAAPASCFRKTPRPEMATRSSTPIRWITGSCRWPPASRRPSPRARPSW